ncbi:hypothetical protein PCURB6_32130 [Paenibacillus curdlanolyticus]|nr:hypothetical protein PCURB6_32130 [Paenibacillus curdlanolyticus]
MLRSLTNRLWNENHDLHISNSEWFIMARIYKKQPTISYVTKHVDISRQATHKFIKSLESKGLVEISKAQHNNKDKCIRLTEFGEQCYEKNAIIKASLEAKIVESIGSERAALLKELLQSEWGL